MMNRILIIIVILFTGTSASATTYYIDVVGGLDTNTSTQAQSKLTPWAHAPCMLSATSNAAAYTSVAGDSFIFKGGVTWPHASWPCHETHSGSNGNPITFGVDQTWFTGGVWTRPILTGGSTPMTFNSFFQLQSVSYITVDNFEMTGLNWNSNSGVSCMVTSGSTHITVTNLYIHGWTHTGSATIDEFACLKGDTVTPFGNGDTADHIVFDGSDSTNSGDSGAGTYAWPTVTNSVFHDAANGILSNGQGIDIIAFNSIYNIHQSFDGTQHDNAYEAIGGTGTYYIHDNLIHDAIGECFMIGNGSDSYYVWNNVIYQGGTGNCNPFHFPQNLLANSSGFMTFWNNVMIPEAGVQCFLQVGTPSPGWNAVTIENNHCITTGTLNNTITTTTLTIDHNTLMTPTTATGQGYTSVQTFAYSPTAGGNSTIGAGVNLTSSWPGGYSTSDTSYACTQIAGSGGQVVSCPTRTINIRPSGSAAWDTGPYEFIPGISSPPAPSPSMFARIGDIIQ